MADEARAAALARAAARAPLSPPPAAVALGAPQLHLGVLYVAEPSRLIVFQQNNSVTLRQFWKSLASAWNASAAIWSNAWYSCETDREGWWGGVAAARGLGPGRAAAAVFRRWPALPCEEAMYDWLGGQPMCEHTTTDCEAIPSIESEYHKIEVRLENSRKNNKNPLFILYTVFLKVHVVSVPLQMSVRSLERERRGLVDRRDAGGGRRAPGMHAVRRRQRHHRLSRRHLPHCAARC